MLLATHGKCSVPVEPADWEVKRAYPNAVYINKDGVWVSIFARKNNQNVSKNDSDCFLICDCEYEHVATLLYSDLKKKAKKKKVVEQIPLFDI